MEMREEDQGKAGETRNGDERGRSRESGRDQEWRSERKIEGERGKEEKQEGEKHHLLLCLAC